MDTLTLTLAMVALKASLIIIALRAWPGPIALQLMVGAEMWLIAFFAPKLMQLPGGTSTVTNICYATVIVAQLIVLTRWGERAARETLTMSLWIMTIGLLQAAIIAMYPTVAGNEVMAGAIDAVAISSIVIVGASYASFWLSQEVLFRLHRYWRKWPLLAKGAALIFCAQLIDSSVFFSVAFPEWSWAERLHAGLLGFGVKVAIGVAMLPLLLLHKKDDHATSGASTSALARAAGTGRS